jgi:hypothetical protein|nr:MAG TPA: hypothetical protein [Caudoviricetes sp.]
MHLFYSYLSHRLQNPTDTTRAWCSTVFYLIFKELVRAGALYRSFNLCLYFNPFFLSCQYFFKNIFNFFIVCLLINHFHFLGISATKSQLKLGQGLIFKERLGNVPFNCLQLYAFYFPCQYLF